MTTKLVLHNISSPGLRGIRSALCAACCLDWWFLSATFVFAELGMLGQCLSHAPLEMSMLLAKTKPIKDTQMQDPYLGWSYSCEASALRIQCRTHRQADDLNLSLSSSDARFVLGETLVLLFLGLGFMNTSQDLQAY